MAEGSGCPAFDLSEDRENYFRLLKLVVKLGTFVLHDVLNKHLKECHPGNAYDTTKRNLKTVLRKINVVKALESCHSGERPVLTDEHWSTLYPVTTNQGRRHKAADDLSVNDLDMTLSIILLRYITKLNPNDADWDSSEDDLNDGSVPANVPAKIAVIRGYRDKLAHAPAAAISSAEFSASFSHAQATLISLSDLYKNDDYVSIRQQPVTIVLKRLNWVQFGEDFDRALIESLEEAIKSICGNLERPKSNYYDERQDHVRSSVCVLL